MGAGKKSAAGAIGTFIIVAQRLLHGMRAVEKPASPDGGLF